MTRIEFAIICFFSFFCFAIAVTADSSEEISSIQKFKISSLEETYLKTRDDLIRKFSKASAESDDNQALMELEKQLRTIIGAINIDGVPKQGKINLITLFPELGFGQVDGLRFDSDSESLFVTTGALLDKYLDNHPKLSKNLNELSKTDDFYRLVFSSDAMVIKYAKIPVNCPSSQYLAYSFLGLTAQDIGPFIPREIYVFVTKGNKILLVHAPSMIAISDISECKSTWDKYDKKRSEAYDAYRASKLKDQNAFNDSIRYDEQGFLAYRNCYGIETKNQQFFIAIKRQAQSIVDRLLKD